MVTKTKRLPLTLDPELGKLIAEIAELRDIKQTRVVTELLEECRPQLQTIRDALFAIKNNEKPNHEDILIKLMGDSFQNITNAFKSLNNADD
jgi:wyosine [tRNA(Phe)-imidazoG37] synthetase (radical SAM superfamily)